MNSCQCFDGLGGSFTLDCPGVLSGQLVRDMENLSAQDSYSGRAAKSVMRAMSLLRTIQGEDLSDFHSGHALILIEIRVGLEALNQITVDIELGQLRQVRDCVDEHLKILQVDMERELANAKDHSYRPDNLDGKVSITLACGKTKVQIFSAGRALLHLRGADATAMDLVANMTKPHRLKSLLVSYDQGRKRLCLTKTTLLFGAIGYGDIVFGLSTPAAIRDTGDRGQLQLKKVKTSHHNDAERQKIIANFKTAEAELEKMDALRVLGVNCG